MFEITCKDAGGRIGKFTVNGKTMITPAILPVVHPKVQVIPARELRATFKIDALFTNAYIIHQDAALREQVLASGVHAHLDFPGIIATDSGAFQHYMYGTDDLRADVIEPFQERIGSDLGVILDQPVQVDDPRDVAVAKVRTTLDRARENVARRASTATGWYGPVHGSRHPDLLERSAREISALDFQVHALGGVVKLLNQYQFPLVASIVIKAKQHVDPSRPVHLFGAGHPVMFALFVALGCDLFDSAAYSLFARDGRYLSEQGTWQLADLVEFPCACPVCSSWTPAELRGAPEPERYKRLAEHNLHATVQELRTVREHVRGGSLWHLVEVRCRNHPKLLDALRVARHPEHARWAVAEEPFYKSRAVFYTGPETLGRPDILAFRDHVENDYSLPDGARVLLFLPDLDASPVSSPQHAAWRAELAEIVQDAGIDRRTVTTCIVNPVLGVIPEELLPMYPCSHVLFPAILDAAQERLVEASVNKLAGLAITAGMKAGFVIPGRYTNELGVEEAFDGGVLAGIHETLARVHPGRVARGESIAALAAFLGGDQ